MRRLCLLILGAYIAAVPVSAFSGSPRSMSDGRTFFEKNVVPKLAENGCPMCHAVGYVHPNVVVYDELMPYLAMGTSPEQSAVIRKIANLRAFRPDIPTHVGGPRCETLESEPCRTIIQWWQVEFGAAAKAAGASK